MRMGTEKNRAIIHKDLEALQQLILVAKEVLDKPETRALKQTLVVLPANLDSQGLVF